RVVRILRGCGLTTMQLNEIYGRVITDCASIPEPKPSSTNAQLSLQCSDVVLRWRRDHRFLTGTGAPRQLPLEKASPNFSELVAAAVPNEKPGRLLEAMKELGA